MSKDSSFISNNGLHTERRTGRRFPASLEVDVDNRDNINLLGIMQDCSYNGLRVAFDDFAFNTNSCLQLRIKRPKKGIPMPAIAEVKWKKQNEGRWNVGFQYRDIADGIRSEILIYSSNKKRKLNRIIILSLIPFIVFSIWFSLVGIRGVWPSPLRSFRPKLQKLFSARSPAKLFNNGISVYKINGIAYSTKQPNYVIINNDIFYLNDVVIGGRIVDISQDDITLRFPDKEIVYRVGEKIEQ